jgi:ketosteroid isomerase-like protein
MRDQLNRLCTLIAPLFLLAGCASGPEVRDGNIAIARGFLDDVLAGRQEAAKAVLAEDFEFTFMGHSEISRSYDRDAYFDEWLPVVFTLLPNGITLDVRDIVADEAGVVLTVRGDAAGVNGEYDNDYAMVFRIRDGRIISFEEFCSDLLVETRLFERELVEIE